VPISRNTTSTIDSLPTKKTVKKPLKRKVTKRAKMAFEQQNLDPNLLLNPTGLGITMMIPAAGNFFKLSGLIIKRQNPENPIEILERIEERDK
jgi:hypothetical protein